MIFNYLRVRTKEPDPRPHRGRIFKSGTWWRYKCLDCDYGASTASGGRVGFPWLVDMSAAHAHPDHWSRRGRP